MNGDDLAVFEHGAETHAAHLLKALGVDLRADGMARTPYRMAHALAELTRSLHSLDSPAKILARDFDPPSPNPQMVFSLGIEFVSVCEHHLLPFFGTAAVAYLPKPAARIIGISKLARLVEHYATRPQMQERLGQQIVTAIMDHGHAQGAGCLLDSTHTCQTLRGPRARSAHMLTSHLAGCFLDQPVRQEFLTLARRP